MPSTTCARRSPPAAASIAGRRAAVESRLAELDGRDAEAERAALRRQLAELVAERNRVVEDNLGLIWAIVRRMEGRRWFVGGMDPEDAANYGVVGLIAAAERYDAGRVNPSTGRPMRFSTYASAAIENEIRRQCAYDRFIRVPADCFVEGVRGPSVTAVIDRRDRRCDGLAYADTSAGPVTEAERREEAEVLNAALEALPVDARDVLLLRAGGATRPEVVAELGIGKWSVPARERQAMQQLREALSDLVPVSMAASDVDSMPRIRR